jgi:hypothetical protein
VATPVREPRCGRARAGRPRPSGSAWPAPRGEHAVGHVVQPLEPPAPGAGDLAGPEQELQRAFQVVPVPPGTARFGRSCSMSPAVSGPRARTSSSTDATNSGRSARCAACRPRSRRAPGASASAAAAGWSPAAGTPRGPSTRTACVAAATRRVRAGRGVRAEPAEQRQVVAPDQHVDRVDLEEPDAAEHAAQRRESGVPGRRGVANPCAASATRRACAADSRDVRVTREVRQVISSSFSRTA